LERRLPLGQSVENELVHPARRTLYERGFKAQIDADRAEEMFWLMLYTWQALLKSLPVTALTLING